MRLAFKSPDLEAKRTVPGRAETGLPRQVNRGEMPLPEHAPGMFAPFKVHPFGGDAGEKYACSAAAPEAALGFGAIRGVGELT